MKAHGKEIVGRDLTGLEHRTAALQHFGRQIREELARSKRGALEFDHAID
jgi:hypothetical protein